MYFVLINFDASGCDVPKQGWWLLPRNGSIWLALLCFVKYEENKEYSHIGFSKSFLWEGEETWDRDLLFLYEIILNIF